MAEPQAQRALAVAREALRAGRAAAAIEACAPLLVHDSADAAALLLTALAHAELGELDAAAVHFARLLEIAPTQPAAVRVVYADVMLRRGDALAAERIAVEAVAAAPAMSAAHNVLAAALHRQGRLREAQARYAEAIAADPRNPTPRRNLSDALRDEGRLEEAIEARRALGPQGLGGADWLAIARMLHARVRLEEAIEAYRAAVAATPADADAWNELGNAYADTARHPEAQACYREALRVRPAYPEVASTLLIELHYDPAFSLEAIYRAHLEWARVHAASIEPPAPPVRARRERLRVGLLSPALREGPTGTFVRPLFDHLDRARFEVYGYNARGRRDALTEGFQRSAQGWHDAWNDDDDTLAARIRADGIDVLVDLAGHTPGGRPLVLARKPAPVIVTWLDYFDTTGLEAVDYLIGDPVSTPEGGAQPFRERVLRLAPCRLCYTPPQGSPAVASRPRDGAPVFGSFNRFSKMEPEVIASWARLLARVPGSRLLHAFDEQGVAAERIELRGHSPHARMLEEYGDIDIALDTFPYNGGLTTCEALWMGVPVLCRLGDSMISRQSAALARAAGLDDWVVTGEEELVRRALAACADRDGLATLRASQRERLLASPLMDAPAFAARFGELLLEAAR
jgi:protein O-GlcNAc transferase